MGRTTLIAGLVALAAACDRRADAEREAREAAARAREVAVEQARRAGEAAGDEARRLEALAGRALAGADLDRSVALARRAKAELDRVYRTSTDYDLDVVAADAAPAHAAKLAALPHVTIGDVTVGYEQVAVVSATGVARSRHFRATWRRGDRDVIVGYQTQDAIDLVAFAALLDRLVPAVERALAAP